MELTSKAEIRHAGGGGKPANPRQLAERIAAELRGAGFIAYFAGGCVRDALTGGEPKDFDIATDARPEQVAALFRRTKHVGAHFGVVLVRLKGIDFEVATFRTDGDYKDGRRPESVAFSTPEQDAQRRDFTINGLFYDPAADRVIDFVGGRQDLDAGVIRAIGDPARRFAEDYLRLMRAVRFAARFGFEIEPATWSALRAHAPKIAGISAERTRDEFSRILAAPSRLRGFDLLVESGLMAAIMPEVLALRGCEQPPQFHPEGDVFVHTRLMLSLLDPGAPLPLVLSVLLHDIGKPATQTFDEEAGRIRFNGHDKVGSEMAEAILRRLKYPNDVVDAVCEAVACHMQFMDVQKMKRATLRRFMARPNFDSEMALHRVDCLGSNGYLENYKFLEEQRAAFAAEPVIPPRLLTGGDLIARGWTPGPLLGKALEEVQTQQLEGNISTKEEALAFLESGDWR